MYLQGPVGSFIERVSHSRGRVPVPETPSPLSVTVVRVCPTGYGSQKDVTGRQRGCGVSVTFCLIVR